MPNVGSLMTRTPLTLAPEATLEQARSLLADAGIRHVPVVERGRIVGVLSQRDLMEREPLAPLSGRTGRPEHPTLVRDRMTAPVEAVSAGDSLAGACRRMVERRIGTLPVVQGEAAVGVLSELDLLVFYRAVSRYFHDEPPIAPPVSAVMSADVLTIAPGDRVDEGLALCRRERIRHLPVVEDGWLAGIVSDRDLLPVAGRGQGDLRRIADVMTTRFVSVVPEDRLAVAAERMIELDVHSMPVAVDGALKGIVTSTDVLEVLAAIDPHSLAVAWRHSRAGT